MAAPSTPLDHADDIAHMRAALALGAAWPRQHLAQSVGRLRRRQRRPRGRPGGHRARRAAARRTGRTGHGGRRPREAPPSTSRWSRAATGAARRPAPTRSIKAGVARVVIATRDPDPRVDGAGHRPAARGRHRGRRRRAAGARPTNWCSGFRARIRLGRPLVTLKLASTLDGRIATRSGESRWITGEPRAAPPMRCAAGTTR